MLIYRLVIIIRVGKQVFGIDTDSGEVFADRLDRAHWHGAEEFLRQLAGGRGGGSWSAVANAVVRARLGATTASVGGWGTRPNSGSKENPESRKHDRADAELNRAAAAEIIFLI